MTDRPSNPVRPTPAAIKLAERYGITPEAMEEIISGTQSEYRQTSDAGSTEGLTLPPVHDNSDKPAIEEAATIPASPVVAGPVTLVDSTAAAEPPLPTSEKVRPVAGNPTAPATPRSVVRTQTKSSSAGVLTAVFVVIVICIAIALSFQHGCFRQRKDVKAPTPVDTIQNMLSEEARKASTPPVAPTQTTPGQVPPEALAVPREEPPGTSGKSSNSGVTSNPRPSRSRAARKAAKATRPVLETSSNLDAQERLAELRANGNSKARIKAIHKGRTTIYQVQRK